MSQNQPNAGFVRFVGEQSPDGFPLVPDDLKFEVCQEDGTWIPFRGVCRASIDINQDECVTADVTLEIGGLDLSGIMLRRIKEPSIWQRLQRWYWRLR